MEYFILSQKQNIPNGIIPHILSDKFYERKQVIEKDQAGEVNDVTSIMITHNPSNVYYDVIDEPVFLVSDAVKKLINIYDDSVVFKFVMLTDEVTKHQEVYWLAMIDKIDCISDKCEFYKDNSLKKLVLDKEKVSGKKIFRVDGIREKIVVISLDLAESMLRRYFVGVELTRAEAM